MTAPILVFGATGGIGEALTRRLIAANQPVFLSARDQQRLAALAGEVGAPHAAADILDEAALGSVVQRAAEEGALGGLAFCVGSIVVKPLHNASAADFLEAFRLNVLGPALAVKAAGASLKQGRGSVVLFSSVAVGQGFTHHSVISAAKGGVEGLVRALAAELAPEVRVNAVAPSLTRTPLAAPFTRSDAMARGIAQLHALARLGEADDIAAAAAFLLSPDSGWVTGQVIGVDGGRSRVRTKG
ncbi:MAG: SDR family oxidoreductase [Rhodospirillales bacterium]|nr:SDR family oxidoreductase [Rhodospirillales bacterium]